MSDQVYGGPSMQAYTAQREAEFAERQAEADKLRAKTFNVLELEEQSKPYSPGLLELTMRDEFAAYIRGWSDGASSVAMRIDFTSHATLATPYNEGYTDGRKARSAAHVVASEKYGVRLSIVRTPEKIGE